MQMALTPSYLWIHKRKKSREVFLSPGMMTCHPTKESYTQEFKRGTEWECWYQPYFVSPLLPLNFRWLPRHTTTAAIITVFSKVTQKMGPQGHFLLGSNCIANGKFCTLESFLVLYWYMKITTTDGGDTKESRSSVTQYTMPHVYSWGYLGWWWCQVIRSLLHQTLHREYVAAGECHSYFAYIIQKAKI